MRTAILRRCVGSDRDHRRGSSSTRRMSAHALTTDALRLKPDQSWEWCLRQVVGDTVFSRGDFEEAAMLVLARLRSSATCSMATT